MYIYIYIYIYVYTQVLARGHERHHLAGHLLRQAGVGGTLTINKQIVE